jgi:hypothetical protein
MNNKQFVVENTERSLMARATVSLLIVMGNSIRRFESFPSPPYSILTGSKVSPS